MVPGFARRRPPLPCLPARTPGPSGRCVRPRTSPCWRAGWGRDCFGGSRCPRTDDTVAVLKVCPQCGTEYETAARFCPPTAQRCAPRAPTPDRPRDRRALSHPQALGEGGMGRVYLAEHVKMGRKCAIKVMSPALGERRRSATRFNREASNAAASSIRTSPPSSTSARATGLVYLAMEYVDGEPLTRLLAREAPLVRRARGRHRAADRRRARRRARARASCTATSSPTTSSSRATRDGTRGGEGRGLRHREGRCGDGRRGAHAHRARDRHARVHEPRAAARRPDRRAQRHLRAGLHPVPDAHRARSRSRRRRASR